MSEFVLCVKCSAKWETDRLERKGVTYCELCYEPGLRYMREDGTASEDTFPRQDAPCPSSK
jgi:hypothetical protein